MIDTSNENEAKKLIKKAQKPILIRAQNDEFNRKILEYGKFDGLVFPSKENRKNTLRQVNSGMNEVLAKIASKNRVALGFDFSLLSKMNKKEKAEELTRLKQNIFLARKSKVRIIAINHKDKANTSYLLLSLGSSSQQAKEATSF